MINRTLVRTKVIFALFAYYTDGDKTRLSAEKELLRSFSDTYNLYFLLLELVNYLTSYAQQRQDEAQEKAVAMHQDYNANPRFVNNRFARQIFENRTLRRYTEEHNLSWDSAHDSVALLYKQMLDSQFYQDYMNSQESSYEADKAVWRKIYTQLVADSEEMETALDELEVVLDARSWTSDVNIILSFIIKTIKRFKPDSDADQPLLEMFSSEEEVDFAKGLLRATIEHSDEYERMIEQALQHWDKERVAFMDMVILKTAIAELINFPDIALQVTLNEYLDIAHEYSTDNSPQFINGVLDQIIKQQHNSNKLIYKQLKR